jgi:hypothetical protein
MVRKQRRGCDVTVFVSAPCSFIDRYWDFAAKRQMQFEAAEKRADERHRAEMEVLKRQLDAPQPVSAPTAQIASLQADVANMAGQLAQVVGMLQSQMAQKPA